MRHNAAEFLVLFWHLFAENRFELDPKFMVSTGEVVVQRKETRLCQWELLSCTDCIHKDYIYTVNAQTTELESELQQWKRALVLAQQEVESLDIKFIEVIEI